MQALRMTPPTQIPLGAPCGRVPAEQVACKRNREATQHPSLAAPSKAAEPSASALWGPPYKQIRGQVGASGGPFAALTVAANRVTSKLLSPSLGGSQKLQSAVCIGAKGRAVLAVKGGNEAASATKELSPLGTPSGVLTLQGPEEKLTSPTDGSKPLSPPLQKEKEDDSTRTKPAVQPPCSAPASLEEPWRVSQRCRLFLYDLSAAYSRDTGQDNNHNSRTAQSGYCQEAFRADGAHPGDYLKGFKRLTPEARDLIVCILNKVAIQLAQQGSWQPQGKPQDSLDPRVAAVVGVAVQLFDRVMAVIHKGDAAYGVSAERKQHPLRGLAGRGGTSPLLLNQLIAIACFSFADRLEAIAATDYGTLVGIWRQNTAGMLRSAWPSSLTFTDALRSKLLLIERIIVAYIAPSGNIAVAPTSELTESLLNVGFLFATAHYRCALRKDEASPKEAAPSQANPFEDALICRGVSPAAAASTALSLRVSGSSRVDISRQVAQVFVRLALLDRNICLQFKPSTVAAAAAQLAMFHSGGASSFPPELQAALGAAAAAVAATGGTASFRAVRRCQFLMLHKWLSVKRILLQRGVGASGGSPGAVNEYLPDRLIAEWVQRGLTLPHHRRVLLAVQQHANSLGCRRRKQESSRAQAETARKGDWRHCAYPAANGANVGED
ncbi:hypothetical protein cyc_05271 [Cyclospora cayetanensis]|uniref:Cyclin C-terminal domain-containing protein n=1 Tax=Cyclospora cayetanensis TaxID=88456 RepID=A0A1D3D194_9EIME|nr:hypothetical protein cyc_05271 [Cyclospora cayetanensis]